MHKLQTLTALVCVFFSASETEEEKKEDRCIVLKRCICDSKWNRMKSAVAW